MYIGQTTRRCAAGAFVLLFTLAIMGVSCQGAHEASSGSAVGHVPRTTNAGGTSVIADAAATADAVAPNELAAIQVYWARNFYADTDIQHSFDTASGSHIDCISFAAQHSVRAMLAHGQTLAPPPPTGIIPPSVATANIPGAPGGNDGTLDATGNARACPTGTVMKTRPSVAEIEASGGVASYAQQRRPRPQSQSTYEHDCWDSPYPIYYTSSPPAHWCGNWNNNPVSGDACGDYDHEVGIQTTNWLPTGSSGYFGLSAITPVYAPTIDPYGWHSTSQFWMQTGTCVNWWNGEPGTSINQQCPVGNACGDSCAVQDIELGTLTDTSGKTYGFVFYTPDGYFGGCYAEDADSNCPCYAPNGCPTAGEECSKDSDCASNDEICDYDVCHTVNPYVETSDPYYVPMTALTTSPAGERPNELPIEVWNGTAAFYPYYYVYMFGQWIGWYPNSIFRWPYSDGAGNTDGITDAGGAGLSGPMVTGPATYLQAGGEVLTAYPYVSGTSYHSQTSMGSDYPPNDGFEYAAYMRNVQYLNSGLKDATLTFTSASDRSMGDDGIPGLCGFEAGNFYTENNTLMFYDMSTVAAGGSGWGEYFYFGTAGLH